MLTRRIKSIQRRFREARLFAGSLVTPSRPILAHLVPIRRCNLSCTYCNEFDQTSQPVPTPEILSRVDHLARLGTPMLHLSGGEPMLHPGLEEIVRHIRRRGMLAGILTNGLLLSPRRILALNRAGLDHLQISIDNVLPDDVSKKSLRVLDRKLRDLARHALFDVNINTVLGGALERPEDALTIARRTRELGLSSTVGIIHDPGGRLKPLEEKQQRIYAELKKLEKPLFRASSHNPFQDNLVRGLPNDWHCRAGGRYLYICEDGLVHYCSQQRGHPGIPLADYDREDLRRESLSAKECAPYCTISCVHRVSWMDKLRENPRGALQDFFPAPEGEEWTTSRLPLPVRALAWTFLGSPGRDGPGVGARTALRILGVRREEPPRRSGSGSFLPVIPDRDP